MESLKFKVDKILNKLDRLENYDLKIFKQKQKKEKDYPELDLKEV